MNKWVRILVTYFFGWAGIHKFIDKKYGMGFLYLLTFGLFAFGWIYDTFKAVIDAFRKTDNTIVKAEKQTILVRPKEEPVETVYETFSIPNSINDFSEATIYNEIRILQETSHLIDTSKNIDTVIGRIQFIPEHIAYLKALEKKGLYRSRPSANDYYQKYILQRDVCIQQAIIRGYKDTLDKANQLKTEKGRINKINKYFEKLESYKPMLSPIMGNYIDNFIATRK